LSRHLRWQVAITLLGFALLGSLLAYLAFAFGTVVVPAAGGTYVEALIGQPQYINPILCQPNPVDRDLCSLIFNGLTKLNERGEVLPDLAESWEISTDGLRYTFHLRRDVRWHDQTPFTADDVVFTVEAMQDPRYKGDPYLAELWRNVGVVKLDTHTIQFVLREPFAPFLSYATIGILPAHALTDVPAESLPNHPFNQHPIGTGMFQVEEVTAEDALLQANPLFQNKLVRQALLYAIDRQELVDRVLDGRGVVAHSPILPESWAHDNGVARYEYDPERAKDLLMEAGWRTPTHLSAMEGDTDRQSKGSIREQAGVKLAFTLLTDDDPLHMRLAEEIARQWEEIGVRAIPQTVRSSLVENYLRPRKFEAALIDLEVRGDPDPYPLWHSTQANGEGQNYAGFVNYEVDKLLEEARCIVDLDKRAELYHRFQQTFADEVPSLLLYYPVYTYAVDEKIKGVQLGPLSEPSDRFRNIAEWYVVTKRIIIGRGGLRSESLGSLRGTPSTPLFLLRAGLNGPMPHTGDEKRNIGRTPPTPPDLLRRLARPLSLTNETNRGKLYIAPK